MKSLKCREFGIFLAAVASAYMLAAASASTSGVVVVASASIQGQR